MNRFDTYATEQIEAMLEAGREVLECHLVLAKTGDNVVGQLLPAEGKFHEFDHCPAGDIFDDETTASTTTMRTGKASTAISTFSCARKACPAIANRSNNPNAKRWMSAMTGYAT